LHNLCFTKWDFVVLKRYFFLGNSVENFRFEENTGIITPNAREKKALCLNWASRHSNYKTWGMSKVGLW